MADTIERVASYGVALERRARYPNVLARTRSYGKAFERVAGFFGDVSVADYYADVVEPTLGAANIVAHYRLDETSGTTATDASGNGNDGTYTNGPTLGETSLITGGGGTSVDFGGTNEYLSVGAKSLTNFIHQTGVFTISAWIDYTDEGDNQVIFSTRGLISGTGVLLFIIGGSNIIRAQWSGGGSVQSQGSEPSDGTHHILYTGNGSTQYLYVDGVLLDSDAITTTTGDSGITPRFASAAGGYFNGRMDELTIANVHADAADVTALYNGGTA